MSLTEKSRLEDMKRLLRPFYSDSGPERVGFILGNRIVEVANVAPDPNEGFAVSAADVIKYTEEEPALATWHTHPGSPANLSGGDYRTFQVFSSMLHFIVGKDGERCYGFDKEKQSLIEVDSLCR